MDQDGQGAAEAEAEAKAEPDVERALDEAVEAVAVHASRLEELSGGPAPTGSGSSLAHLFDVPVPVTVEVGRARMSLGELARLGPGAVVELDREAHEPAEVYVNGKLVARGDIVTVDQSYGVRITWVAR